jgi:hypothetical protein
MPNATVEAELSYTRLLERVARFDVRSNRMAPSVPASDSKPDSTMLNKGLSERRRRVRCDVLHS